MKKIRFSYSNKLLLKEWLRLNYEKRITKEIKLGLAKMTDLSEEQIHNWLKREKIKLKKLTINDS